MNNLSALPVASTQPQFWRVQAEAERLRRKRVSRRRELDYNAWLFERFPSWPWDKPHLEYVRQELERFTSGEFDKLMLFMPPRHYKSQMVTVRYAAWYLEQHPKDPVIIGAYNQTLANKFSRQIRKIARSHGLALSPERQANHDWETVEGGGVRAVGVGAGVTGHGGNLIIIDDPVKNREEADSPAYRDRLNGWYDDDISTRLEPGGKVILIQTRWHQNDLAGYILGGEEASDWHVVSLPALAGDNDQMGRKPGEPLDPERFSAEHLLRIKATKPERTWYSLYQQVPRSPEGNVFHNTWWEQHRFDAADRRFVNQCVARYLSFDTALKDKDSNDYTAVTVGELMPDYRLNIRQVWRRRLKFPDLPDEIERFAERYNQDGKLRAVIIEDKASGTSALQTLRKTSPDWLQRLLIPFMPVGDKVQRAEQAAVWCKNGCVWLPQPGEAVAWLHDFTSELFDFPAAEFDDQVDSFSQLILYTEPLLAEGWHARGDIQ